MNIATGVYIHKTKQKAAAMLGPPVSPSNIDDITLYSSKKLLVILPNPNMILRRH